MKNWSPTILWIKPFQIAWRRVWSNHFSFFPLGYNATVALISFKASICHPHELFLFLFLGFCSVAPLHCLFKVKRSELDTTVTWVWLMQSISKEEMASQTPCVLPALAHKQWATVVIIYYFVKGGEDPSYSNNDYSREKNVFGGLPQSGYLLWGEKCACFGAREMFVHICAGGAVHCCGLQVLTLHLRRTEYMFCFIYKYISSEVNGKWTIECWVCALKSKHTGKTFQ